MAVIDSLAQAIAIEDGFYGAGNRAQRNNNPGNLWGAGGGGSGDFTLDSGGFRIYATPEKGWAALYADLSYKIRHHPEWTILNLFDVWLGGGPGVTAPASQGNSMKYATDVANSLSVNLGPGFTINTTLGEGNAGAVLSQNPLGQPISTPGDTGTSPQGQILSPDGTDQPGEVLYQYPDTGIDPILWVAGAGVAALALSELF